MKSKKLYAALSAAVLLSGTAFAQAAFDPAKKQEISDGMNSFAEAILESVPEAATQQNVWSDSYIGQFFPNFHFGAGVSIGGTQLNMSGLKTAATALAGDVELSTNSAIETGASLVGYDQFSFSISNIPEVFVLPTASVDLRIGGVLLPFDVGVSAMVTNPSFETIDYSDPKSLTATNRALNWKLGGFDGTLNYMAWGIDGRYCLYEGDFVMPKISVGGGYYSINGAIAVHSKQTTDLTGAYTALGKLDTDVNMGVSYTTKVAFAQVQANKDFSFINVFGGIRGIVSASTASWSWSYDSTNHSGETSYEEVTILLKDSYSDSGTVATDDGIQAVTAGEKGTWDFSGVQPQIFLGASGSLFMVDTSFSICADVRSLVDAISTKDFKSFIWSGALSIHFKL